MVVGRYSSTCSTLCSCVTGSSGSFAARLGSLDGACDSEVPELPTAVNGTSAVPRGQRIVEQLELKVEIGAAFKSRICQFDSICPEYPAVGDYKKSIVGRAQVAAKSEIARPNIRGLNPQSRQNGQYSKLNPPFRLVNLHLSSANSGCSPNYHVLSRNHRHKARLLWKVQQCSCGAQVSHGLFSPLGRYSVQTRSNISNNALRTISVAIKAHGTGVIAKVRRAPLLFPTKLSCQDLRCVSVRKQSAVNHG